MDKQLTLAETYFGANRKHIALLIDPDKHSLHSIGHLLDVAEALPIDFYFIGGSLLSKPLSPILQAIKARSARRTVLFPGNNLQVDAQADALLFLSLISGRNPEFLIGQHVHAAPMVYQSGLDVIPTGYVLIDGGAVSSVEYISNTRPIPANKPQIAVATCLAGQYLGLQAIYLEAGSGAANPVPPQLIAEVAQQVHLPLIVGGGIRSVAQAQAAFAAGASTIVLGTVAEKSLLLLQEICNSLADWH